VNSSAAMSAKAAAATVHELRSAAPPRPPDEERCMKTGTVMADAWRAPLSVGHMTMAAGGDINAAENSTRCDGSYAYCV